MSVPVLDAVFRNVLLARVFDEINLEVDGKLSARIGTEYELNSRKDDHRVFEFTYFDNVLPTNGDPPRMIHIRVSIDVQATPQAGGNAGIHTDLKFEHNFGFEFDIMPKITTRPPPPTDHSGLDPRRHLIIWKLVPQVWRYDH